MWQNKRKGESPGQIRKKPASKNQSLIDSYFN
jgi:hypothetical protein